MVRLGRRGRRRSRCADHRPAPPSLARGRGDALRRSTTCSPTSRAATGSSTRSSSSAAPGTQRGSGDAAAPVGETEFVTAEAERAPRQVMGGIVAHADLTDAEHLDDVLDAHETAANGRLRGIRHAGSHALHPEVLTIPGRAPVGLYADPAFRAGVARLGERGLTYDTWHYHYQNQDFADLARAVSGTTMVLDHFGTPLGVGPYASQREQIFGQWTADIVAIATCDNVVAKIGGLAMPDNGFGWHTAERPPTSDEFVAAQRRYYLHTIEQFGPESMHVRIELPRRPALVVVPRGVERLQEDDRRLLAPTNATPCCVAPPRGPTASDGSGRVGGIIAAITSLIICERGGRPGNSSGCDGFSCSPMLWKRSTAISSQSGCGKDPDSGQTGRRRRRDRRPRPAACPRRLPDGSSRGRSRRRRLVRVRRRIHSGQLRSDSMIPVLTHPGHRQLTPIGIWASCMLV